MAAAKRYKQGVIWVVGRLHSDFQRYLDEQQITYGLFADKKYRIPSGPAHIRALDFSGEHSLQHQVSTLDIPRVSGIITAGYESYVVAASQLAAYFRVPGPSVAAAFAATDKAIMRQRFRDYVPDLNPDFSAVHNLAELEQFAAQHKFPLMLKPANLMKSLFVTKNNNLSELRANYQDATQQLGTLYEKYGLTMEPNVIVEEFLAGSMHTVAGFVDAAGQPHLVNVIADCVTAEEVGKPDSYIFSRQVPSRLAMNQQTELLDASTKSVKALGVASCPVHIEMMLTATGPKVIEIGARVGGYRPRLYRFASGIDLYQAILATATNEPIDLTPRVSAYCAAIELFPDNEGVFLNIDNMPDVEKMTSLQYCSIKAKPGQQVGRANQGYRATAVLMLGCNDRAQLEKDCTFVLQKAKVRLSPKL